MEQSSSVQMKELLEVVEGMYSAQTSVLWESYESVLGGRIAELLLQVHCITCDRFLLGVRKTGMEEI